MSIETILELDDVTVAYDGPPVLERLSLKVPKGERLALIGRNGAGKSTLLRAVMGLAPVSHGAIRLRGQDITRAGPFTRAGLGIGLVPQNRDIFPSLTVEQNLRAAMHSGSALEEAYALFPRLRDRRRNQGGELSPGEQQMLAIARTLMTKPELLLLDEPLEGLAPMLCDMLMRVFELLAGPGHRVTVILVEQHTEMALDFADRVVLFDDGAVLHDGPARRARKPELLEGPRPRRRRTATAPMR